MLTKQRKGTIPFTLTVTGQGVEAESIKLVFHNRRQSEVVKKLSDDGDIANVVLFLIESWECRFPLTNEGIMDMEDELPGMIDALITAFHEARTVGKAKN